LSHVNLQVLLDNTTLSSSASASRIEDLTSITTFLLTLRFLDTTHIKPGENDVAICVNALVSKDLEGPAATVVLKSFVYLLENSDESICVRFGQALQSSSFMKHATIMLANVIDSSPLPSPEYQSNWRLCFMVLLWLSSATGNVGAKSCVTLGTLMLKSARNNLLPSVINDDLTNYLFLGGPSSNINRLKVVLPILPALVCSLINLSHQSRDYSTLTKFLATAGVALKSDFVATAALKDSVQYLGYLIVVVREIQQVIASNASAPAPTADGGDNNDLLLDLSFDNAGAKPSSPTLSPSSRRPSLDISQQLIACQDLTLDACSSLLVDSMHRGGSDSTQSWRSIIGSLKSETPATTTALLTKLTSMSMQRTLRSEEQPWSPGLCEGMSRLCLLIEEKRLLNVTQGRTLDASEIKLLQSILDVMRVGREAMGWHQVAVGTSGRATAAAVGGPEVLQRSAESRILLTILQPSLRIALTTLCNLSSSLNSSIMHQAITEIEMTVHAASSGLAFAGSRDVGLLVMASLRKAILCRQAANDDECAGEYASLVSIVVAEMTQRHEIEKLQKETQQEEETGSTQVVEALMFGSAAEMTNGGIPDALSPHQILPSSSTTLGWANYAGLGDTLKIANMDSDSSAALVKLSAYLDAWDECAMRESQDELLDLFDEDDGGSGFHDESAKEENDEDLAVQAELLQKFIESQTQDRQRINDVKNEVLPQRRKRCAVLAASTFENAFCEMLEGGEMEKFFERSVADGGLSIYSRHLSYPIKQQFSRKLPKYMLTNSQILDAQDPVPALPSPAPREQPPLSLGAPPLGVEIVDPNSDVDVGLDKSIEQLGLDIIRKTSLTVKDITLEQVQSNTSESGDADLEAEDHSGGERHSRDSDLSATPPTKTNVIAGEDITGEYFSGDHTVNNVYEQTCPSDGSLQSGGAGRPEAKFLECLHVRAAGSRECTLFITPSSIVLHYHSNLYDGESMALEEIKTRRAESVHGVNEDDEDRYEEYRDVEFRTKSLRFEVGEIAQIYLRRYRLRDSAVEIFFNGAGGGNVEGLSSSSLFVDFGAGREGSARRDGFAVMLMKRSPRAAYKQWPGTSNKRMLIEHSNVPKLWADGKLSNFDYLMYVNTLAGRSFNDITQYPVFPWILNDYSSETIDLQDPSVYRDLSKPIGALNDGRLEDFLERYHSFVDNTIPPFMYGSHYSTAAGVVLHYNVRVHPFAGLHRQLQGGHFDVADRLFSSVARTWEMCTSALSEVKELTPEWFSNPGFLRNSNNFNFGRMQDGERVDDVLLPPWCNNSPEKFVEMNRAALESDIVTKMLPDWIDLVFGYKQRGQAAVEANNVFFYLTYYGSVDVAAIEDEALRRATELQIAHFGQCPMQLFSSTPHLRSCIEAGPKLPNLKNAIDLYSVDDGFSASSGSDADGGNISPIRSLPFTGAHLTHWHHMPPQPSAAPVTCVRLVSSSRIFTIDSSGGFSFYSWQWQVDQRRINREMDELRLKRRQEQQLLRQSLASAEAARMSIASGDEMGDNSRNASPPPDHAAFLAAAVASAGAGSSMIQATTASVAIDRGNSSSPLPSGAADTAAATALPTTMTATTVDEDVGNFLVTQDTLSFRDMLPRLFVATKTVAISQRTFVGGTVVLVISDGDGRGGMGVQVVDIVHGIVKSQVMLAGVASERLTCITTEVCASSGIEVVALGSKDGSVSVWKFRNSEVLPTRPMLKFSGHNGGEIAAVALCGHLRCVVSASDDNKICVHSLISGKIIRSWVCVGCKITSVAVSKRGFVVVACDAGASATELRMYTVDAREVGSVLLEGKVEKMKDVLDGCALATTMRGAVQLLRLSSCRPFEIVDTWNIDVGGFDLLGGGVGNVVVGDIDFGPDRRLSSCPAVAVAGIADGGVRIHALPGITAWSRTVSLGIGASVAGLVTKPLGVVGGIGKGLLGGLGIVGKGLVSLGRDTIQEINSEGGELLSDVKKQGVLGFFRGVGGGKK
jgi:hypothetical protein